MEVKDYLKLNLKTPVTYNGSNTNPLYKYEFVLNNGVDFIIRRTANGKHARDLVFILSDRLLYIRDSKGDEPVDSKSKIKRFFSYITTNEIVSHLNPYWGNFTDSDTFSSKLLYVINDDSYLYEFLRHGLDPSLFMRTYSDLSYNQRDYLKELMSNNNKIIYKMYDILPKDKITETTVSNLIDIMRDFGYNNALKFLEYIKNSPTTLAYTSRYGTYTICDMIVKFNLDFSRFLEYLFVDLYTQGIDYINGQVMELYQDTITMQKTMYGYIKEKYPEYLKTFHDQTAMKFNLHKQYFQDNAILENANVLSKLCYSDGTYSILAPQSSADIIEEGVNNHHCVASYVERVVAGETSILFMRSNDDLTKSLITLEYCDGALLQSKGLQNRHVTDEENDFLKKWMKKYKIIDQRSDIREDQRFILKED